MTKRYKAPALPKGYYFEVKQQKYHKDWVDVYVYKKWGPFGWFDTPLIKKEVHLSSPYPELRVHKAMEMLEATLSYSLNAAADNEAREKETNKIVAKVVGKYPPKQDIG